MTLSHETDRHISLDWVILCHETAIKKERCENFIAWQTWIMYIDPLFEPLYISRIVTYFRFNILAYFIHRHSISRTLCINFFGSVNTGKYNVNNAHGHTFTGKWIFICVAVLSPHLYHFTSLFNVGNQSIRIHCDFYNFTKHIAAKKCM